MGKHGSYPGGETAWCLEVDAKQENTLSNTLWLGWSRCKLCHYRKRLCAEHLLDDGPTSWTSPRTLQFLWILVLCLIHFLLTTLEKGMSLILLKHQDSEAQENFNNFFKAGQQGSLRPVTPTRVRLVTRQPLSRCGLLSLGQKGLHSKWDRPTGLLRLSL